MPHVRVAPARRHAEQTALERIRRASCAGLDVAAFLDDVEPIVSQLVPNGTVTIRAPFWFTLDPDSHLVTSIHGQGCDVDPAEYMQWELLADDVIKTADVVHAGRGAVTLHQMTDGHPERSPVYVEVMEPSGMAQELLVALRSTTGETWGTTRLNRAPDEPMFTEHEIDVMTAAAPLIAEGVRRGLLVGEAHDPDRPDAPGLAVLTSDGEVEALSPCAESWFARLPDDDGRRDGVPTSVLAAAAGAFREAARTGGGGTSVLRLRATTGGWVVVHGAVLGADDDARATVIVQAAHPDGIAPLLMSIYGLTNRERDVAHRVVRGGTTTELAVGLGVSPLTVQQHLKSIFHKVGVSSRGELVARIWFDLYDPRARDNRDRIRGDQPIRGGPKVPGWDRATTPRG